MSITRPTIVDDDGSNELGTVLNSAFFTSAFDAIDSRWSVSTTTATGTQNNLTYSEADVIRCNNATALTLTGIAAPASPAKPGKPLIVLSVGTGNVLLAHQNANSQASARLINFATSAATPLAAGTGSAMYVYDNAVSRWHLVAHDQGAFITPTFSSTNYTANVGTWTVDSLDVTTQAYLLTGRRLTVATYLSATAAASNPQILQIGNGAWGGFTSSKTVLSSAVVANNTGGGGGNGPAYMQALSGGSLIQVQTTPTANFVGAVNVFGQMTFEVT